MEMKLMFDCSFIWLGLSLFFTYDVLRDAAFTYATTRAVLGYFHELADFRTGLLHLLHYINTGTHGQQ